MKQKYTYGLLAALAALFLFQPLRAQTSAQFMERFGVKMQEQVTVEMSFTLSGEDAQGTAIAPLQGTIYRQGADYVMQNPEAEVYVSGDTRWIYTPGNNEAVVTRNDPASVDLTENPLALFSAQLSKEYKLSGKPRSFTEKGIDVTEISLLPSGRNHSYASILLRMNSRTLQPHSVKYNAKDGSWFEALITRYTPQQQAFPPERFIFSVKEHPGVYVTDLR